MLIRLSAFINIAWLSIRKRKEENAKGEKKRHFYEINCQYVLRLC